MSIQIQQVHQQVAVILLYLILQCLHTGSNSKWFQFQKDSNGDLWQDIVFDVVFNEEVLDMIAEDCSKDEEKIGSEWCMFQRRGKGISLILKHRRAYFSTLNTLWRSTSASTGHLRLAYYGTQFQGLVQFSGTDFRSPKKSLIASAGTVPVTLIPVLRVTIGDKMSHMIVASLS